MNKHIHVFGAAILAAAMAFCACSNSSDSSNLLTSVLSGGSNGDSSTVTNSTGATTTTASTELTVTYGSNATCSALASTTFTSTVYLDLSNSKYSTDNSTWNDISTSSGSPTTIATNVTAYNNSGYIKIDSSSTTNPLKFVLTGTLSSGELFFANKEGSTIAIYMNNASITSGNYPCVEFEKKETTVYLHLTGTNSLTDGRTYGTNYSSTGSTEKGTVHVKGDLNIVADDTSAKLTVTEGYKHGFNAKNLINFYGGIVTVNSSGRNGFQCKNGFNMYGGTAIVYGTGTHTNNESRGIVVEGDDTCGTNNSGYFNMEGGAINIKTVSKAITAKWDSSEDASAAEKIKNTVNPVVTISGGKINIVTYGTPQDESAQTYTFTDADGETVSEKTKLSPEGIEGKAGVTISGGTINLATTDDCINSSATSGNITISGGTIYAYASSNDVVDSNGTLTISGGTLVALTATNPECAFDCDNNTFAITGGTFIGIGTNNFSSPTANSCTQSVIVLSGNYLGTVGKTFALEDSSGNAVFAFTIPSAIYSSLSSSNIAIFSSPKIVAGTSYSLYSPVTVSGGVSQNGLFTTLPTVSGGLAYLSGISTSTSNYVYSTNAGTNAGPQEGTHPNGGPGRP